MYLSTIAILLGLGSGAVADIIGVRLHSMFLVHILRRLPTQRTEAGLGKLLTE